MPDAVCHGSNLTDSHGCQPAVSIKLDMSSFGRTLPLVILSVGVLLDHFWVLFASKQACVLHTSLHNTAYLLDKDKGNKANNSDDTLNNSGHEMSGITSHKGNTLNAGSHRE
jgi:hypothetical protein